MLDFKGFHRKISWWKESILPLIFGNLRYIVILELAISMCSFYVRRTKVFCPIVYMLRYT